MNHHDSEKLLKLVGELAPSARGKIAFAITESTAAMDARTNAAEAAREDFRLFTDGERELLRRFSVEKSTGPNGRPVYTPLEERRRDYAETKAEVERNARPILERWDFWQLRKKAAEKASETAEKWAFLADVSQWLVDHRGASLKPVKPPEAKLARGGNHADAVYELRARIDEIDANYHATEVANAPVADLIARMEADVDALADRIAPALYLNSRDNAPVNVGATSDAHREAFVFWALADLLKTETAKKIKARHPGEGVSDFDRAAELSALAADKLHLERLEESHITAATSIGQIIGRRRDANPLAILEVEKS